MPVIRILIDGYSMLYGCPGIAQGKPRYSSSARDELISWLARYGDASGVPVTVIFDGGRAAPGTPAPFSQPEMEVLYSKPGQTADSVIERVVHRLKDYGDVLVVTNDLGERETVESMGGITMGCDAFWDLIRSRCDEFQKELDRRNSMERRSFLKKSG